MLIMIIKGNGLANQQENKRGSNPRHSPKSDHDNKVLKLVGRENESV
jgi:hypothetical protein